MARGTHRTSWFATVAVLSGIGWMAGSAAASAEDRAVRGVDAHSEAVISKAEARSATVAALMRSLEATDVIVMVQVTVLPVRLRGDMRILAVTPTRRYLLVRVDLTRVPDEQIEWLGHELQHANEVAAAPDVRDDASLARLMTRIGYNTGTGTFETDAAVRAGRKVRVEVLAPAEGSPGSSK